MRGTVCAYILVLGLFAPGVSAAQSPPEILEGVIVTPEGEPIPGARVTVTGTRSQVSRTVRASSTGGFRLVFHEGDGTYSLIARAIGYAPALRRLAPAGRGEVLHFEVIMARTPLPLPPLIVTEFRPPPGQRVETAPTGGNAQEIGRSKAFLSDPTTLEELFSLTPGVSQTEGGGFSVFGTQGERNRVVLDGVPFEGSWMPPDAVCGVSVASTSASPARGGFNGSLASAVTCPTAATSRAVVRLASTPRALSWSDPAAGIGTPSQNLVSGYISTPLPVWSGRARISFAGVREATELRSLLNATPLLGAELGVTPETLDTLLAAAASLGIPTGGSSIPITSVRSRWTGYAQSQFSPGAATSITLTGHAAVGNQNTSGVRLLDAPSRGDQVRQVQSRIQLLAATYLGRVRQEVVGAYSASSFTTTPLAPGAEARVLLPSQGGSATGSSVARLGGGGGVNRTSRDVIYLRNMTAGSLDGGAHRWAFGQELEWERYDRLASQSSSATYQYSGLGELAMNSPELFRRSLTDRSSVTRSRGLAVWIADQWRAAERVGIEGGLRFDDVRHSAPHQGGRDIVDSLFDINIRALPAYAGLSPRIGIAWLVHRRDTVYVPSPSGGLVPAQVLDLSALSGLPQSNLGAGVTAYGSVGLYRGVLPTARAATLSRAGGGETDLVLTCVGSAVPTPDWAQSASLPETCRDGEGPVGFGRSQRAIQAAHSSFAPPIVWRANLGLNGIMLGNWQAGVSALVSRSLQGESRFDRNFLPNVGFRLDRESGRPVYAAATEIDPLSGQVAPGAARRHPEYGSVLESRSDLDGKGLQAQVDLFSPPLLGRVYFGVSYIHTVSTLQFRGLDGSTAGDPRVRETSSSALPRHQIIGSTITAVGGWRFGVRIGVQSGYAYTPLIAGDINADGFLNDRAYIPLAGGADGADVVDAIRASGSRRAAACLERQRGRIAGHNSCRGGWRARLDLFADAAPGALPGLGDRVRLTARLINAGPAILRLLGGDAELGQASGFPDPILLRVTGFDPGRSRYTYEPNLRFGQAMQTQSPVTGFPPFQVQFGVQVSLGSTGSPSPLDRLGLRDGGRLLPEERVRDLLQARLASPVDSILSRGDSLLLTAGQRTELQELRSSFRATIDSLLWPVLERFRTDSAESERMIASAVVEMLRAARLYQDAFRRRALEVLTEAQRIKLGSLMWARAAS